MDALTHNEWCGAVRPTYTEPCGSHNQISYASYCYHGAMRNPKLARIDHAAANGRRLPPTYHLRRY